MRIAVITGASSGMGREFALQASEKEAFDEIWVIARREDRLISLREKIKNVRPLALDLTKKESFDSYKTLLEAEKPDIALLANCSGFGKFGAYDKIPLEDSLGMIDLNCKAVVAMTALSLPYMKSGAKIMNLDSLSSFQPVPYITVYGATKAFVLSYSRAMNIELKKRGIRVMAVCPGWVDTEFFDRAKTSDDDAVTYFNIIYKPADVMRTAVHDLYHTKKDVSIHGFPVKSQVLGVKLLPHKWVMGIWMRQQKH